MADMIGRTLGNYKIIELIARGGMGAVFKAYQVSLDRYVAIKILPESFAYDPVLFHRFEQEAKAAARLRHPSITQVFDFGRDGDYVFLVMEYVSGGTLQQRLKQPMDLTTALTITCQVAEGLGYAHAHGIVHRDVKPSNILFTAEGHAVLSDFGIAKVTESQIALTRTGMGVGTPEYMAPEQAQGLAVDARTDIYSLGAVLYQMTTGRVPFQSDTPLGVVLKHLNDPVPMPRSINSNLPEGVEKIITTCLEKDPAKRFESAAALIKAITAVLSPSSTSAALPEADGPATLIARAAPQPAPPPPAAKPAPDKRKASARPATAAKPAPVEQAPAPRRSPTPAPAAKPVPVKQEALSQRAPAPMPAAAGEQGKSAALPVPAPQARSTAMPAEAQAQPVIATPAQSQPAERRAPPPRAQDAVIPVEAQAQPDIASPAAQSSSAAAKPAVGMMQEARALMAQPWLISRRARPTILSGMPLAVVAGAALMVTIVFLAVGALAVSAIRGRGAAPPAALAVQPTQTSVAALAKPTATVVIPATATLLLAAPSATPTLRPTASLPVQATATPAVAAPALPNAPTATAASAIPTPTTAPPAGSGSVASLTGRLVFANFRGPDKFGDFDITLLEVPGGTTRVVTQFGSDPVFSPDGQRILYYSWIEAGLYTMNTSGKEQVALPNTKDDDAPAWSHDGKRIAVMNGNAIWVMNSDGSGRTKIIAHGDEPSWSPDGKQIAYRGCVATTCGLAIADADGKNERFITKDASDSGPAWHPSGDLILFTSKRTGQAEVWLTNTQGSTVKPLTNSQKSPSGAPASSGAPTWSADGKTVIFLSDRDGAWGIYIMNPDGSGQRKIAALKVSDEWWRERVSATK